jgi:hypothetical protein
MTSPNFRTPGSSRPSDNGLYIALLILLCAAVVIGLGVHQALKLF